MPKKKLPISPVANTFDLRCPGRRPHCLRLPAAPLTVSVVDRRGLGLVATSLSHRCSGHNWHLLPPSPIAASSAATLRHALAVAALTATAPALAPSPSPSSIHPNILMDRPLIFALDKLYFYLYIWRERDINAMIRNKILWANFVTSPQPLMRDEIFPYLIPSATFLRSLFLVPPNLTLFLGSPFPKSTLMML